MNRRKFLRGAFTVIAIISVAPTSVLAASSPPCSIATVSHGGVTYSQLAELIKMTLDSMPKRMFEVAWDTPRWEITDIYKRSKSC